jgi:hypothetical protein
VVRQDKKLIKLCDPTDLVTQDLILEITAQEQTQRGKFVGFLYEYERGGIDAAHRGGLAETGPRLLFVSCYEHFWQCAQNQAVRPPIVAERNSRPQRGHLPPFRRCNNSHDLGIRSTWARASIAFFRM